MAVPGLKAFRKVQIGKETTNGTAVAADKMLLGTLTGEDVRTWHEPDDDRGLLARYTRRTEVARQANLHFEGAANYQQILDFLAMSVRGVVEPAYATPTSVKHDDNGAFTTLTNAFDDNTATSVTIAGFIAAQDKLYVNMTNTKFRAIRVDMGTTVNAVASVVSVECSLGAAAWGAATLVEDGTSLTGASLGKDGYIVFTPHADWATDTVDSVTGYFVRLTFTGNFTASVKIVEVDTVPIPVVWTFTPTVTGRNAVDSYTFEFGDDQQMFESEFCFATNLELAYAMNEVVMCRADIIGRQFTKASFTSLTAPTVEDIITNKTSIYVNPSWATLGNTVKSDLLVNGTVRLPTGQTPVKYADGQMYFSALSEQKRTLELELTLAFNSDAVTEYDAYVAQTQRFLRLKTVGSTIQAPDTYYLQIDVCGRWQTWSTLEDRDGEDVVRAKFVSDIDSSNNTWLFVVCNDIALL